MLGPSECLWMTQRYHRFCRYPNAPVSLKKRLWEWVVKQKPRHKSTDVFVYIYIYIFILEGHNDGLCIWFCLYMCISQIYILTHTHNIESFHILSIVGKMTTSMHYMHVHLHISATNSYCNHPLPTDRCTHVAPQRLPAHLGKEGFRVFPAAETKVDIKSVRCPVSGETNWWKHPGCVKPKGCQMT